LRSESDSATRPLLTHRVDGDGPPLILLNGGMMSIAAWDPFAIPLARHARVVRCDFRGQLLSGGPFPKSLEEHSRDVVDLLDALSIESAHWIGVSFGAEVAMAGAAQHPDRVRQLTIISATERTDAKMREDAAIGRGLAERAATGSAQDGAELFRRIASTTWSEEWLARQPADFIQSRAQKMGSMPAAFFSGAAAILTLLEDLDLTPVLGQITAPTLVIGGSGDALFPPEHSRAIAAAIPGARLEIIEGGSHGLIFEKYDRVLELLS
jgi:3-oxoadipate enol-lactonase